MKEIVAVGTIALAASGAATALCWLAGREVNWWTFTQAVSAGLVAAALGFYAGRTGL